MPNTIGPTQRLLFRLVCPLMVVFAFAANLNAQGQPDLAPAKVPDRITETLAPQQAVVESELYEIAEVQKRMGGSVGERLEGVVPGANPNQQFRDSYKKFAAAQEKKTPTTVTLLPAPPTRPLGRCSKPDKSVAQAVLRASAKKLEDLAAELEQVQFYDKADELRKMAAKYWLQARSMD